MGSEASKFEYVEIDNLQTPGTQRNDTEEILSNYAESSAVAEKRLSSYCHKVDRWILVYAIVLCVLNQSDRGSIGVAKVVGLEDDLGMTKNDFNIATTLFTVGYLSLEVFSNFVLKRVGASKLLPTLGILWGCVCALQGVIHTRAQLFAMRVLLGMAECGFTAGILLILSFFYPKSRLTTRVGFFYLSSPLANVFSGPLASALSHINHPTIKRWQWVFILEGLITVVVSVFGYFILQDHPEKASFLSDDDKEFIISYKKKEGSLGGSQHLSFADTKRALSDWQLWFMTLATFATCAACSSVGVFAPELINELGFTAAQSQAMSALPSACGAIAILLAGHTVKLCRSHWLAGSLALGTALLGSILLVATLNVPARIFGLCLLGTGGYSGLGIFPGWSITANSQTVADSAVASAVTVFMGSASGFVSSNIFLNTDKPRFVIGHSVNIGLLVMGIAACVVTRLSMQRRNRRLEQIEAQSSTSFADGSVGCNRGQGFRFAY
ncbi:major facilitator superfamily domain-containing protein [Coemansia spiralis]|nr:major facilitator superfamily domain-containing protein [Coemansia spiralis]